MAPGSVAQWYTHTHLCSCTTVHTRCIEYLGKSAPLPKERSVVRIHSGPRRRIASYVMQFAFFFFYFFPPIFSIAVFCLSAEALALPKPPAKRRSAQADPHTNFILKSWCAGRQNISIDNKTYSQYLSNVGLLTYILFYNSTEL